MWMCKYAGWSGSALFSKAASLHSVVGNASDCRSQSRKFEIQLSYVIYVEIEREIISTVILFIPWLKKGSCQLLAKVCAQVLVNTF